MAILRLNKRGMTPSQQDIASRLDERLAAAQQLLNEMRDLVKELKEEPEEDEREPGAS